MTINVTNLRPTGRDFELAHGYDNGIRVTCLDNSENVLDLTDATEMEWIMQPSVSDNTGKVTKTYTGSGITFESPLTGGFANISILDTDHPSLGGESTLEWYHRCTVTIGGLEFLLFSGTITFYEEA